MRAMRFIALPALALLAGLALGPAAAPAKASIMAPFPEGSQPVNVSVGFNTRVPLPDLSEETLAAAQKAGREYLYHLAKGECALLKAVIAKTCRLTNLNVNSQIQQQHQNAAQPVLYINGTANFTIGLQDEAAGGG